MTQQQVAQGEERHGNGRALDDEKPVKLGNGHVQLVDDAVEHRIGEQTLAAIGIQPREGQGDTQIVIRAPIVVVQHEQPDHEQGQS